MTMFGSERTRKKGKREWVKNAVIVFLALMLVLTFFSNTIMNRSLPEVAAQYPQAETITTKIRGSGTVEATQTYNATIQEARTVASVGVKVGDKVKAGQTLLTLDETESQELQEARTAYNALKLEYDKMLLDKGDQNNASAASMAQAQAAVSQAQTDLYNAQQYEAALKGYQSKEAAAQSTVNTRQSALDAINTQLEHLDNELNTITTTNREYLAAVKKSEEAKKKVDELLEQGFGESDPQVAQATQAWNTAQSEQDQLLADLTLDVNQRIAAQKTAQIDAQAALTQANNALTAAQNETAQYTSSYTGPTSVDSAKSALQSAQDSLASLQGTAADTAEQKKYDDSVSKLDADAKEKELQEAREKVEQLEKKAAKSDVVSRYDGLVKAVNVAAGDKTEADTPLVIVELTEKGYLMNATVTKDQAKTLREGLQAEITNLWDSGITLTLTSIAADKNDPANSRTLTFAVQGDDVAVGQQLSFSVGDKNANFDVVVPSSAVHTDADGSFVYTVAAKSTPLSTRYTVKKTTVKVLASDEKNTAVSGDVTTGDFVVTTATVPLEAGMQIRIAE